MMNLENSIVIYIDNDYCNLTINYKSSENIIDTNNDLFKIIKESWEKYIKDNIVDKTIKCIISTGNTFIKDIRYKKSLSVCGTKEDLDYLLPNYNFASFPILNIDNYEEKIKEIIKISKEKYTNEKILYFNLNNNKLDEKYKKNIICENYNNYNKNEIFYELIKNKILLIDDYNLLPYVLATGRTIILLEKEEKDWFFYNETFIPWIHYIPIDDFAQLNKIIEYTINNKAQCDKIGKMGQEYVLKYLNKEKILERIAEVLLKIKKNKKNLDTINNQIISDINSFVYTSNTSKLLQIILYSSLKISNYVLQIEIKNNELKILHNVKIFERRAEGIIKLIKITLKYKKIRDGIFYIMVGDEHVYEFPNLPFLIIAKPIDKNGILFVDNTFLDIEPETKTFEDKSKMISWKDNKDFIDNKCNKLTDKINKIFFIGKNISLKKTDFNIRKWINENMNKFANIPLEILLTDKNGYMPMSDFCKYKYLLNLPGNSPWSFRFKFLFLMKSLIINIVLYRKYGNSYDKKWINIFDSLFVPNKDYIEISYY